jgi:CubicO group peptidase (beta-lactamase class C family)
LFDGGAATPGLASPERRSKLVALAPRLDENYRSRFAEPEAVATVVGIVLDGELVYSRAFGVRDVVSSAPADIDTVFRMVR